MEQISAFQTAVAARIAAHADGGEIDHWEKLGEGVGGARWRACSPQGRWLVKSAIDGAELYAAEADGLLALMTCGAVRVPRVLLVGEHDEVGYLVMEWLALAPAGARTAAAARLGEALARQHRCTAGQFGWVRSNFIGTTPQFNTPDDDWMVFLRERRLGFQLRLAAENGYRDSLQQQGARLLERLPEFFAGYVPAPSLLHGDLWGGNWGVLEPGEPVIFDPAIYYGDREADIAMTELFGGFPREFYRAYERAYPLDPGYRTRRELYNLYHLLNHLNLFGDSYLSAVERSLGVLSAGPA